MLTALLLLAATATLTPSARAATLETNFAQVEGAPPAWVTASRLNRVADKMQGLLEWDIRKIRLRFMADASQFRSSHGLDDTVLAYTIKSQNEVTIGPRVTTTDFDAVLGHELVHVILGQKYKGAVPGWLEEGLANHLVKYGKVDYAWLAAQPERNVLDLAHPFGKGGQGMSRPPAGNARYAYQASQALMEMIATHCTVIDLVAMSVGKKLENYLPTLCGIDDLNSEFKKWLKRKSRR